MNYTCSLFQIYFKGGKIWWLFVQLYKNITDCFVLEVSTGNRFQSVLQTKKTKIKFYATTWESLH